MEKQFTYLDNLGRILQSSPEPFQNPTQNEKPIEGFENYSNVASNNYDIYSETLPDNTSKYTLISLIPKSCEKNAQMKQKQLDLSTPEVPDVIASKMYEESKMSVINTVYVGSITIIGLYVLFKILKI